MEIGGLKLKNKILLAPMAGITDYAFRKICCDHGAELCFTEMVSAKAIIYQNVKTFKLLKTDVDEPCFAQLFGNDDQIIKEAAVVVEQNFTFKGIDINMGCPAPKIFNNFEGAYLLNDPKKIEKIVKETVKAIKLPVSVKLRLGIDNDCINAVECAKICEGSGASFITIHGRTKNMYYSGKADLKEIYNVKNSVNIPVIGNGDVVDVNSYQNMLEQTGCDAVMIGRGALGNPFIFKKIIVKNEKNDELSISLQERLNTLNQHVARLLELKGEHIGMLEARKHANWYLKGLKNAKKYKEIANKMTKHEEIDHLISIVLQDHL